MSRNRPSNRQVSKQELGLPRASNEQVDLFGQHGFPDMDRMMEHHHGLMSQQLQQMNQMMGSFGGFRENDFMDFMGRDIMQPFGSPLENMNKFSDVHKKLHDQGKEGVYHTQTFVSSSVRGPDGKVKEESYFEKSAGQRAQGHTISQKQQGYKNNEGVNRLAQERMLNDKGRKIIKNKNGDEIEESNHYYNMDGDQIDQFDNEWEQTNKQTRFVQNQQKYNMIGQEPRRESARQQLQYNQPTDLRSSNQGQKSYISQSRH